MDAVAIPLSRRSVLAGALACAACGPGPAEGAAHIPLKNAAHVPVGCSLNGARLGDKAYMRQFAAQFSQLTPEWEMKMGPMLTGSGELRTEAADRIAQFARDNRLKLHGTTFVWYKNPPPYFQKLAGEPKAFEAALRKHIVTVMGRYAGLARGWDVVNEPLDDFGKPRPSLWQSVLGDGYIERAFAFAAEGDGKAVAFLNEYDLEKRPAKLDAFLRLVERLLKAGVKIGGIGSQSHLNIDTDPKKLAPTVKALAQFGLPIHISELDISTAMGRADLRSDARKFAIQADLATRLADAFMALPQRQRYAFTLWGLRDDDSWLMKPPMLGLRGGGTESPLAFTPEGKPKPMAAALARALSGKRA